MFECDCVILNHFFHITICINLCFLSVYLQVCNIFLNLLTFMVFSGFATVFVDVCRLLYLMSVHALKSDRERYVQYVKCMCVNVSAWLIT